MTSTQNVSGPPIAPPTDLPVGEILRRARLQTGQSLEEVEYKIRIRASQIEAIEAMDLDALPGWVYVVGFVRTYAEYLGLDGDKVLQLLKSQIGHTKKQELNFPVPASESQMPDKWMIIGAVIFLLLMIGGGYLYQSSDRTLVETVPPIKYSGTKPDSGNQSQDSAEEIDLQLATIPSGENKLSGDMMSRKQPGLEANSPSNPDNENANQHRITINVLDKSWVEIRNSENERVISRILAKGDIYYVPDNTPGMTMTTGNAGGIQIVVDGEVLGSLGEYGTIRRDIPLEAESLKEMF